MSVVSSNQFPSEIERFIPGNHIFVLSIKGSSHPISILSVAVMDPAKIADCELTDPVTKAGQNIL